MGKMPKNTMELALNSVEIIEPQNMMPMQPYTMPTVFKSRQQHFGTVGIFMFDLIGKMIFNITRNTNQYGKFALILRNGNEVNLFRECNPLKSACVSKPNTTIFGTCLTTLF